MHDPLDTDRYVPDPMTREHALVRFAELMDPSATATALWDEIIAPLYDARRFAAEWPRGRCRECNTKHPGHPLARSGPPAGNHLMHCSKYTGPLRHRKRHTSTSVINTVRVSCTCGRDYPEYDRQGRLSTCPNADLDWRGPKPEAVTQG